MKELWLRYSLLIHDDWNIKIAWRVENQSIYKVISLSNEMRLTELEINEDVD